MPLCDHNVLQASGRAGPVCPQEGHVPMNRLAELHASGEPPALPPPTDDMRQHSLLRRQSSSMSDIGMTGERDGLWSVHNTEKI